MQHHLEQQVQDTAAVVADWKNTIAKIETEFNIANLAWKTPRKLARITRSQRQCKTLTPSQR
jgi:hypothetical protein